ncbi:ArsR/SmtB family transcription factor [Halomicrobium salinisoli]|uniref:ArsR/SmtB family transcription factor n=1 Tax=Halomicrobium salinisoli TaxID=2878391 RepID=UPI001CF02F6E|nr:helix-turn-helix domain-containing protein [Halomicrobium salinisoli]
MSKPLLPEDSVLDLADYLAMQRAIGNETRFRILRTLARNGDLSATELRETLDVEANNLHYHLDELVDVGLVQNRKRSEPDRDGLYSYYRVSPLGETMLDHGVEELLRRGQRGFDRREKPR